MDNQPMNNQPNAVVNPAPAGGKRKLLVVIIVVAVIVILGFVYLWWQGQEGAELGSVPAAGGDISAPTDDTTSAIQSDLDAVGIDNLDQEFQEIDNDLNQL